MLSPADLKCLSLCNQRLYALSRMSYGPYSTALTRAKKLFILARFERDLPQYFACYVCQTLHKYDGSESFGLSGLAHKKTCRLQCDYKGYTWADEVREGATMSLRTHSNFNHSRSRFSHHQLKLAMRRFQYGKTSGINIESLSWTQVRPYFHPLCDTGCFGRVKYSCIPTLFSIEAQICPKPLGLYIRMQDMVLFPTWEDLKMSGGINPMRLYEICFHTKLSSIMSELDAFKYGKELQFTYTCSRCNTVCAFEIFQVEGNSMIALVMTRWINLGQGLDYEDPLWRIRAAWCLGCRPEKLPHSMMTESPRLCFESQSPESFEELCSRNLFYLTKDRYKMGKPFVWEPPRFWYIPYKEPPKKQRRGITLGTIVMVLSTLSKRAQSRGTLTDLPKKSGSVLCPIYTP